METSYPSRSECFVGASIIIVHLKALDEAVDFIVVES